MAYSDRLKRDPAHAAAVMVWFEYSESQIRGFLIEECKCEPDEAKRLYDEAQAAYDAEEAAEDEAAESAATMRPLAEVALEEEERHLERAVLGEHIISKRGAA